MVDNSHPTPVLLSARGLTKRFVQRRLFARHFEVAAIEGVDLELRRGSAVALVGESGSGKSTLARCLAGLESLTAGEVSFAGVALDSPEEWKAVRSHIQLVLQDAAASLNPRFSAVDIVAEPLLIQNRGSRPELREQALRLMDEVGLPSSCAEKRPVEFSGGQRQRLAIARALTLQPELLILDEALSGLDLSFQAQIIELLLKLRASHSLTYLFISHDLGLVEFLADEVAVMERGRIVERAATRDLFARPQHATTQALLAAIPGQRMRAGASV